jgi:GNAT superfamily N-acetyltransferase
MKPQIRDATDAAVPGILDETPVTGAGVSYRRPTAHRRKPMQPTIRDATEADVAGILELARIWIEEGLSYCHVAIGETELRALGPWCLVAETDGEVVGYAQGFVLPAREPCVLPDEGEYLSVEELFVRADHRGDGAGSRMLEILTDRAREAGLVGVMTFTDAKDQRRMLKFYEERGYRGWGIQLFRRL